MSVEKYEHTFMLLMKYMDYIKDENFKVSHFKSVLHVAIIDYLCVLVC